MWTNKAKAFDNPTARSNKTAVNNVETSPVIKIFGGQNICLEPKQFRLQHNIQLQESNNYGSWNMQKKMEAVHLPIRLRLGAK